MTSVAANIKVRALQREGGPLLVIEKRGLPLGTVVTFNTLGYAAFCKLFPMDIVVAILALGRSCLEVHIHQPGFHVRRLMTIDASRGAVRAQKGERGTGMIESGEFSP